MRAHYSKQQLVNEPTLIPRYATLYCTLRYVKLHYITLHRITLTGINYLLLLHCNKNPVKLHSNACDILLFLTSFSSTHIIFVSSYTADTSCVYIP